MSNSVYPLVPAPVFTRFNQAPIKPATPDLILLDDGAVPAELMASLIFEDIGGVEILSVTRNDLINNQNINVAKIKNTGDIAARYNSKNIISLPESSEEYFNSFPIKMKNYVPTDVDLDGESVVYLEPNNDLVINVVNIGNNESVEVEILASGSVLNGTIY